MNPDLLILFTGEIIIILALYRFLLRDWVIQKWEEKIEEEGWLIVFSHGVDPKSGYIETRKGSTLFRPIHFGTNN